MHLPLVSSIQPSGEASNASFYPRIAIDGRICMAVGERESDRVFFVDDVGVFDILAGKLRRTFRIPPQSPLRRWEVHVTNKRLIVRRSMQHASQAYGKDGTNNVTCYAGHVPYAHAHILSAIYHKNKIVLALCVTHADKTISALTLASDNLATMRLLLEDLHQSIDLWLDANNRRLTPWGISDKKYAAQCEEWQSFTSTAWKDGGKVVLVPCDMVAPVPNPTQ